MKKFLEILKSFFGDELNEEEIAKAKEIEEDAQKEIGDALNVFDQYKDDFVQPVLDAIHAVAKIAVTPAKKVEEPDFIAELTVVEKAGARLSKATIAQLKKIGEIIGGMLAAAEKALGKKGGNDDEEEYTDEDIAKFEKLKAYEKAEKDLEKKTATDAQTKLQETIDELTEKVEKLEKKKPLKKGLNSDDKEDDPGDKKDGDEEEFQWSSLTSEEEEED